MGRGDLERQKSQVSVSEKREEKRQSGDAMPDAGICP